MNTTIKIGIVAAVMGALSFAPARAQYQNSVNGEAARIQQDAASGLINQGQARSLEMRDAQIQNQEQQYMMQNGGRMTFQESRQIRSELKGVNHSLGRDVQRDSGSYGAFQSGYPNMQGGYSVMQAGYPGTQVGYPGTQAGYPGMQAGYPGTQNGYQSGYSSGYGMQHHHHSLLQSGMNQLTGTNSQYGMNQQYGMNLQYGNQYSTYGQQGGVGGLLRGMFNH